MRCLLFQGDHVVSFEDLPGVSEREAVTQARAILSSAPAHSCDGFELWELARLVLRQEKSQSLRVPALR